MYKHTKRMYLIGQTLKTELEEPNDVKVCLVRGGVAADTSSNSARSLMEEHKKKPSP